LVWRLIASWLSAFILFSMLMFLLSFPDHFVKNVYME